MAKHEGESVHFLEDPLNEKTPCIMSPLSSQIEGLLSQGSVHEGVEGSLKSRASAVRANAPLSTWADQERLGGYTCFQEATPSIAADEAALLLQGSAAAKPVVARAHVRHHTHDSKKGSEKVLLGGFLRRGLAMGCAAEKSSEKGAQKGFLEGGFPEGA